MIALVSCRSDTPDRPPLFAHEVPITYLTCREGAGSSAILGRVTDDSTGLPIEGAGVWLARTRCRSVTDSLGGFRFGGLTAADYMLTVAFIGYTADTLAIAVGEDDTARVHAVLEPRPVHFGGCSPEEISDPIPEDFEPLSREERLNFIRGYPTHGWPCQPRSRRLRLAADSAAIAFYADLLMGREDLDGPWYRWVALRWVAESGYPQYVPVFLRYARPVWTRGGDSAPYAFYAALDGLARRAYGSRTARTRLFDLAGAELEDRARRAVISHIVRINVPATRDWLRRQLDEGIELPFDRPAVERWLSADPCTGGEALNLETLACEPRAPSSDLTP